MKKDQDLVRLGSRVKLLKRQLQEWGALLIHQQQVRDLTNMDVKRQSKSTTVDRMTVLNQITNQAIRLSHLNIRQTEERHQLKARHEQEAIDLEQAINTH